MVFRRSSAQAALSRSRASRVVLVTPCRFKSDATGSFSAGMFCRKVGTDGFPFPAGTMGTEETENWETLVASISDFAKEGKVPSLASWQDAGATAAGIAIQYGGLGLSHTGRAKACMQMGLEGFGEAVLEAQHNAVCTTLLANVGGGLEGKYLTQMAAGTAVICFCPTELGKEFDCSASDTVAVYNTDTNSYVLNGSKILIGYPVTAPSPTHYIVVAKTETQTTGASGAPVVASRSTLFLVEAAKVTREGGVIQLRNTETKEVLGAVGEGFQHMMVAKHTVRCGVDAGIVGLCKGALAILQPHGATAGVAADIAKLESAVFGAESALLAMTGALDAGSDDSLLDAAFASIMAQRTAFQVSKLLERLCINGGVNACGLNAEQIKRARKFHSQLSSVLLEVEPFEELQNITASCGVEDFGVMFTAEGTLSTMMGRLGRTLGAELRLPVKVSYPEVRLVEKQLTAFGDAVEALFITYGRGLKDKQKLQERIAYAGALIYSSAMAISRAAQTNSKSDLAHMKTYVKPSMEEAAVLIGECTNSGRLMDDALSRVVNEMIQAYVPVRPDSPELKAIEEVQKAEQK